MPRPYYTNDEEKKKFLEDCRDVFTALDYSKEEQDKIIDNLMNSEKAKARDARFDELLSTRETYEETRALYDKYSIMYSKSALDDNVSRVLRGLYKPENSVANIKYNELINQKCQTKQGIVELLQEAVTILASADKSIYTQGVDPKNIMNNYNEVELGFVALSLVNSINNLKKANVITEEDIPSSVVEHLHANVGFYETASSTRSQLVCDTSIVDLIVPEDVPDTNLNMACALLTSDNKRPKEFIAQFAPLIPNRDSTKLKGKIEQFVEPSDDVKAFYDKINKRLAKDKLDFASSAKRVADFEKDGEFYNFTTAISLKAIRAINKDVPAAKVNQKKLDDSLQDIFDKSNKMFAKPLNKASKDMYDVIMDGDIIGHDNEHYKAMEVSMKAIKKMLDGDYSKEQLREELTKLDDSVKRYLEKKYNDKEPFSGRAMKRINAARMASSFVKATEAKLVKEEINEKILEQRNKLAETADVDNSIEYGEADCNKLRDKANEMMKNKPSPQAFAKYFTYSNAAKQLGSGLTISGEDLKDLVENNVELYTEIYNKNKLFSQLIDQGSYQEIIEGLPKIYDQMEKDKIRADKKKEQQVEKKEVKQEAKKQEEAKINMP